MSEVIHHRVTQYYDDDDPMDILNEPEVRLDESFSNVVVVDHIPVAPEDRYEKLLGVIRKLFSQVGTIAEDGLYVPRDDAKQTKGFAFIEFTTKEAADNAVERLNNFKLDKSHVFHVIHFEDFKRYEEVADVYVEPVIPPYEEKENLNGWLTDPKSLKGEDQFVVRQAELTEIYRNKGDRQKKLESRSAWTDTYVVWSPLGSYLATFHRQGIQIWGGPKFTKIMRFNHNGARLIEFSPCENYLVTFSPQFAENDDPKDPKCVVIWNVKTGAKMRGFASSSSPQWPIFQWSHDDKFFAKIGEEAISVYETPSMGLLDKQSIKIPGVKDFSWSPSQNVISYFVPEKSNVPAKVVLLNIPSKKELRQKNLFSVTDCKLHWQQGGKYLCVKVDRLKTKKTTSVSFELFRMREKAVPIESVEIPDAVHAFAWEPKGDRFAIIHGENVNRADISFYTLAEKNVKKLHTLEKKQANSLFWSPAGDFIVLAGLRNLNGLLEFYSVAAAETLANEEHNMCTNIEWDPSGRYVTTYVSHWRHQIDTGYNVYTFAGKLVSKIVKDKFFQFLWRPRPASLLTDAHLEKIQKNSAQLIKVYKDEEKRAAKRRADKSKRVREETRRAFNKHVEDREKEYAEWRKELASVIGRDLDQEEAQTEYVEEREEELYDFQETIVE